MITNKSGKFEQVLFSHKAPDAPVVDAGSQGVKNTPENGGNGYADLIPDTPTYQETTKEKLVRYLGEWWWLWLVVGALYLLKKGE